MAEAAASNVLTEIPNYVHKKPVPMMPLGNAFLLVWTLENLQVLAGWLPANADDDVATGTPDGKSRRPQPETAGADL